MKEKMYSMLKTQIKGHFQITVFTIYLFASFSLTAVSLNYNF